MLISKEKNSLYNYKLAFYKIVLTLLPILLPPFKILFCFVNISWIYGFFNKHYFKAHIIMYSRNPTLGGS